MKASILTFSQTGNTLKVGNAIVKGLQNSGFETEHIDFFHRKNWSPTDADLIGIGCPVFENRPAEVVPDFIKNFNFTGKKAFVFITSGASPARSLFHLAQAVTRAGAVVLGGIQIRGAVTFPTLFGFFSDRPDEKDIKYSEDFGSAIGANILQQKILPDDYRIDPDRGGRFYDIIGPCLKYIKIKATPLPKCDPHKCDLCATCVNECPTGSIKIENKSLKFHKTCIVCYRCWHVCPHLAISLKPSPGNGFIERTLYSENMERFFGDLKPQEYPGPNLFKDVLARKIRLKYDRKNPTAEYEYVE